MKFLHKLQPNWPIFALFLIVSVLAWRNIISGTYLTGWDNLHPEFSPVMNIQRSLFAVWQEYQGLGLLGGMGHATDLLHQLLLYLLSFVLPENLLRYFWTFLMLFVGSSGMYTFLKHLFFKKESSFIPFLGALFYLLNLATIQTFFVPFEAFIAHFAALPWLIFSSLLYLTKPTKRQLFFLILVLVLATPAAYIPTLFVVFMLALSILTGVHLLFHRSRQTFISALKLYSIIFLVNAFWLLPFLYFTATNADVNISSKINQMATETIYLQNKEFGGILDVMLLKGFWFNNVDPNFNGVFTYMLLPWRDHLAQPVIAGLGYFFFGIIILGIIAALKKRSTLFLSFLALFLFAVMTLAITTPPFSWMNALFREAFPLLNQAFRFPFTKFSLLTGFTYAVFFALGISFLIHISQQYLRSRLLRKIGTVSISILLSVLLIVFSLPAFQGNLLYQKETIAIPKEYFALFHFFEKQDPHTRIANFPQHTFWGWNFYDWGYGGSGFLWYGIQQPILDRAFDVWSLSDEVYYYELSQALYAKDKSAFLDVLNKYQITWLLVDKNVINPISPKALFVNELESLITDVPEITKSHSFGDIDIYHVSLKNKPQSFVFLEGQLPKSNTTRISADDQTYKTNGAYIADTGDDTKQLNYYYPFPSLFSLKTTKEQPFTLSKHLTTLQIENKYSRDLTQDTTLTIPSYAEKESLIPALISAKRNGDELSVSLTLQSPTLLYGGEKVWGDSYEQTIFTLSESSFASQPAMLDINGIIQVPVKETGKLTQTFLSLTQNNLLTLTPAKGAPQRIEISGKLIAQLPFLREQHIIIQPKANASFALRYPLITDGYVGFSVPGTSLSQTTLCDPFRTNVSRLTQQPDGKSLTFFANNATACSAYFQPTLPHDQGYALFLTHQNETGRGFHFWVLNQDGKYAPIDTFLPEDRKKTTTTFVLTPQESFGQAYSFHFDSSSIGKEASINTLSDLSVYPLPYDFLTSLHASVEPFTPTKLPSHRINVAHPNESLYVVSGLPKTSQTTTLILSQSYAPGWRAYTASQDNFLARVFPFFAGTQLTDHVKVNNWENGWVLKPTDHRENSHIIIVYLPQYLEYLGFLLPLLILPFFLLKKPFVRLKRDA